MFEAKNQLDLPEDDFCSVDFSVSEILGMQKKFIMYECSKIYRRVGISIENRSPFLEF